MSFHQVPPGGLDESSKSSFRRIPDGTWAAAFGRVSRARYPTDIPSARGTDRRVGHVETTAATSGDGRAAINQRQGVGPLLHRRKPLESFDTGRNSLVFTAAVTFHPSIRFRLSLCQISRQLHTLTWPFFTISVGSRKFIVCTLHLMTFHSNALKLK